MKKLLDLFYKKNTAPTHAGGIVYREINGVEEYLLVSAKRFSFIWVLPKGHIKNSETEEQAALREVKEESGMNAIIIKKIGNTKSIQWNLSKQAVAFYLMKFVSVLYNNCENRNITWLPFKKAISKLFYTNQKNTLKRVRAINC